eukprot:m.286961 g.286961  ORF g.286961 m.286961 type:complete len:311 (-) comp19442_c1_seq6:30-962(-)
MGSGCSHDAGLNQGVIERRRMTHATSDGAVSLTRFRGSRHRLVTRKALYPDGGARRSRIPDKFISWQTKFPDYAPTEYTAPAVLAQPAWADPKDPRSIQFHCIDEHGVDRLTTERKPFQVDPETNRPINPKGRTGFSGRGVLGRWGPNQEAVTVMTRWQRHAITNEVERSPETGERLCECAVVRLPGLDEIAFPRVAVKQNETFDQAQRGMVTGLADLFSHEATTDVDELWNSGKLLYQGYLDDPRNTDNAWVESYCVHFHDPEGELFGCLDAETNSARIEWVKLTPDLVMNDSQRVLVRLLLRFCRETS